MPALPTGIRQRLGRLAELVADLVGSGLSGPRSVGVDRVDQLDGVAVGGLRTSPAPGRSCPGARSPGAVHQRLGAACRRDLPSGTITAPAARLARVAAAMAAVTVERDQSLRALALGLGDRHRHAAILEAAVGLGALELEVDLGPSAPRAGRVDRGVEPSFRSPPGPILDREEVAVALDQRSRHPAPRLKRTPPDHPDRTGWRRAQELACRSAQGGVEALLETWF